SMLLSPVDSPSPLRSKMRAATPSSAKTAAWVFRYGRVPPPVPWSRTTAGCGLPSAGSTSSPARTASRPSNRISTATGGLEHSTPPLFEASAPRGRIYDQRVTDDAVLGPLLATLAPMGARSRAMFGGHGL